MLIYRLESRHNKAARTDKVYAGFYRSVEDWQIMLFTNGFYDEDKFLHPLPEDDGKLQPHWVSLTCDEALSMYFGFSSYQQFKRWFYNDDALELCTDSVVLRIYNCEHVFEGYTQAIFDINETVQCLAELSCTATEEDCVLALEGVYYVP